jgi:hypothetical protein
MYLDEKKNGEVESKPLEDWRQHLLDSATYIEKHGWCQNTLRNLHGQVCLIGSLYGALGYDFSVGSSSTNIASKVQKTSREFRKRLDVDDEADWNDENGRTKEEVVRTMRRIANEI